MRLGQVLREWRHRREIGLRAAGRKIGIGSATLMRLEHGLDPSGRTLAKVLTWLMSKESKP